MTRKLSLLFVLGALLVPTAPAASQEPGDEEAEAFSGAPRLVIKGFGDVNFRVARDKDSGKTADGFSLGQVDLFLTSQLSEKVSVLAELVGKFARATNATVFDVERIHLTYSLSDLVNIRLGRMHTALGFWNQNYHHGNWFQTTAERPVIYLFNDVGGILPIHAVGLEVYGAVTGKALDLFYNVNVVNGRGKTAGESENVTDFNSLKAVNVLLTVTVNAIPGLRLGVVGYFDKAPPNEAVAGRASELDERILGGHLVYVQGPVELLTEGFRVRHEDRGKHATWTHDGFYLQGAYQLSSPVKPYYRFDYVRIDAADVFLASSTGTLRKHTVGVRWDPLTWNGIKLELSHTGRGNGTRELAAQLQTAFTF